MQVDVIHSDLEKSRFLAEKLIDNIERVIVGKHHAVEMAVIALMSQGHLLIEDAPGVGKTMLARSLAKSLSCSFKRIQFTPDMCRGISPESRSIIKKPLPLSFIRTDNGSDRACR